MAIERLMSMNNAQAKEVADKISKIQELSIILPKPIPEALTLEETIYINKYKT